MRAGIGTGCNFRSLYNGLSAGLQRQMCFASVRLGLYDSVKTLYQQLLDGTTMPVWSSCNALSICLEIMHGGEVSRADGEQALCVETSGWLLIEIKQVMSSPTWQPALPDLQVTVAAAWTLALVWQQVWQRAPWPFCLPSLQMSWRCGSRHSSGRMDVATSPHYRHTELSPLRKVLGGFGKVWLKLLPLLSFQFYLSAFYHIYKKETFGEA